MAINGKKPSKTETTKHLNWMGGNSWDINNPILRLRVAASSCFFGEPMYYHDPKAPKRKATTTSHAYKATLSAAQVNHLRDTLNAVEPQDWRGLKPAQLLEKAIDAALAFNPEETLKEAVRLRNEDNIRTTPQVILVRAAHSPSVKGTGLVRRYAPQIVRRGDEPSTGLAYHFGTYGTTVPIPMSLRRAWKDYLEKSSEYVLSKYRMESRMVKTVDVVNLTHAYSPAIDKLMKGELKLGEDNQTWESIISSEGSTPEAWTKALDVMGHMALLRNLRNLLQKGVPQDLFCEKLIKGAPTGKQLPFRYLSAYDAVKNANDIPSTVNKAKVLDAIEEALHASMHSQFHFKGRVMSLVDNSGSAHGTFTSQWGSTTVAKIGNLTGVLTAMMSDDGHVGVFGDRLDTMAIRKKSSVFDIVDKVNSIGKGIGQGTENGIWLFWDKAIRNKEHWDTVFVYSDMQAGHGGLYGTSTTAYKDYLFPDTYRSIDVPKLINKYRREVNPNVKVFLVQIAGYQDTIVPEFYDKTWIIGGWGDGIFKFAQESISMYEQKNLQVQSVEPVNQQTPVGG